MTDHGTGRTAGTEYQVTPLVIDGLLYYCTPYARVFALDPETGEERWIFDPGVDVAGTPYLTCRGVSSWRDSTAATTWVRWISRSTKRSGIWSPSTRALDLKDRCDC